MLECIEYKGEVVYCGHELGIFTCTECCVYRAGLEAKQGEGKQLIEVG